MATNLQEAVIAAFNYDSAMHAGQNKAAADKQKYWQGMAGMLPDISLEGGWNRQEQPDANYQTGVTTHSYSVRLKQPVFDISKIAAFKKGAAIANAADAELRQAQEKLITEVAEAYFSVLHQQEVLQAAKSATQNFSQQLAKLSRGLNAGQNTRMEIDEARANYDLARAKEIQAANDLLVAQEGFRRLSGVDPDSVEPINYQCVQALPVRGVEQEIMRARQNNVDVKIATFQTEQADADRLAADGAHLPVVSVYAAYGKNWGRNDDDDNILYDAIFGTKYKTDSLQYGVSVSVPLFSGGGQLSQSFEAAYRREAARFSAMDARRKAVQDTRSAWLSIRNGKALVDAQTQAVESARRKVRSIEYGKDMGFRTINDELDAQQKYYESLRDLSEIKYRFLAAMLKLYQLTGELGISELGKFQCI
ncbi:MAG: TolC family outer membrane protein [Gibbsiella quercinecans]|uniref:TolC family outer membrane protein n=1 Tax=Gibbsiella quercinecans TaxID=929813 RepID=UPI003F3F339A